MYASPNSLMAHQTDTLHRRERKLPDRGTEKTVATYTVRIPGGQISKKGKAALSEAVKDAHASVAGAPRNRTQVTVLEIASACFWLHGTPLACHQIFVHGFVAADEEQSSRTTGLRDALAHAVSRAVNSELQSVVVSISEASLDKMTPASA
jgi:phenylpyruvate tautomerase PptA (4-oxalocrotonate tautomerase family)